MAASFPSCTVFIKSSDGKVACGEVKNFGYSTDRLELQATLYACPELIEKIGQINSRREIVTVEIVDESGAKWDYAHHWLCHTFKVTYKKTLDPDRGGKFVPDKIIADFTGHPPIEWVPFGLPHANATATPYPPVN